jgi:hypothetical protein
MPEIYRRPGGVVNSLGNRRLKSHRLPAPRLPQSKNDLSLRKSLRKWVGWILAVRTGSVDQAPGVSPEKFSLYLERIEIQYNHLNGEVLKFKYYGEQ